MSQLYRTLTGQSQKSQQSDQSGQAQSAITKTTTTDPLTGTLNHLNEAQLEKLQVFKDRLEKDGWWSPSGINGKPTHDDGTLLRYLRARKFDVAGAVGQFSDTEKWMKEQRVEELYEHYDVESYERARLMYPQWTGHRDRRGIPIYVYVVKELDSKNVAKYQKEAEAYKKSLPNHSQLQTPAKLLPLFALYHNLLNFVLPMVSSLERPNPEVPVTNSTNIVDISGVGLTQFWNLKGHMQDASVLATAHYPETLDRIFIIGAPSFFPTVWGWIKRWFDPVTVSKIFILGKHEVKPTLSQFMHPKDFPKKYGGELDWEWGEVPHMDEESTKAVSTDGNPGWVRGPCLWLDHQRIVVGSVNGKLRRPDEEIAEKKPVVYAADFTEVPVHPDRKTSTISKKSSLTANGTADYQPSRHPSSHAVTAAKIALGSSGAAGAAVAAKSATDPEAETPPDVQHATQAIPKKNLRTAPMDGAALNLPDHQPGHPAQTAEYISPISSAQEKSEVSSEPRDSELLSPPAATSVAAAPLAAIDPVGETLTAESAHQATPPAPLINSGPSPAAPSPPISTPPPAGHTQPGPLPAHAVAMTEQIAAQMAAESLSTIPADANGVLPHPEVIVSSDKSLGLAIEAEKLELVNGMNGKMKEGMRPAMDRFVTAAEF